MQKDFDSWNNKKKEINKILKPSDFYFHEREIWWCSFGINIGYEQNGKNKNFERPALILRKFNRDITLVVPLTSAAKENQYHHKLNTSGTFVILSQIRLISTKRLLRRIEKIVENEFNDIVEKIKTLF